MIDVACGMGRAQANKIDKRFPGATGRTPGTNLKVLVLIRPGFTEQHGFMPIITDVNPSYTIADIAKRLQRIQKPFEPAIA